MSEHSKNFISFLLMDFVPFIFLLFGVCWVAMDPKGAKKLLDRITRTVVGGEPW